MAPTTVPPRRHTGRLASTRGPARPRKAPKAAAAAANAKRTCKACGSTNIDDTDGVIACQDCYTEIESNLITAEVTFEENAGGRATVQGGTVNESARHAKTLGSAAYRKIGGGERNSLADAQQAGKRALDSICPKLGIKENVNIQAQAIWVMASNINFTAGRRTDEVIAACLYAACRRQKDNEVLLMDISEQLKINVFRLGEVYKDLCKDLYLNNESVGNQNLVELEPLIKKYCDKLQFGSMTKTVGQDALRIIKRMNRDWIVSGRHPAGLCGACIILAARMNNFQRSVREVVYVSKVADVTIAKRVEEFRRTKSAGLNVNDFRKHALKIKHQHDPPSLTLDSVREARMAKKRKKREEHIRASMARDSQGQESGPIEIRDDTTDASSRLSSLEPSTDSAPLSISHDETQLPQVNGSRLNTSQVTQVQQQVFLPAPVAQMVAPQENSSPTQLDAVQTLAKEWTPGPPIPQLTPPVSLESWKRKSPEHDGGEIVEAANKRSRTISPQATDTGVPAPTQPPTRIDADGFAIPALPRPIDPALTESNKQEAPKRGRGRPKKSFEPPPIDISQEELAEEDYLEEQIKNALENGEVQESLSEVERIREEEERERRVQQEGERAKTLAAQQVKLESDKIKAGREARGLDWWGEAPEWQPGVVITAEELEKEFENDPEVENCLLSETEVKIKEQIWVAYNEDWLRKQAERELLAKTNKANGSNKPGRKSSKADKVKKKRGKMGDGSVLTESNTPIETPADAARAMLEKRAPQKSAHVDFSALQRIYNPNTPSRASSSTPDDSGAPTREQTPASSHGGRATPALSDVGHARSQRRASVSTEAGAEQDEAGDDEEDRESGEDEENEGDDGEEENEEADENDEDRDQHPISQPVNAYDGFNPENPEEDDDDAGEQAFRAIEQDEFGPVDGGYISDDDGSTRGGLFDHSTDDRFEVE